MLAQIKSITENESDLIANLSNVVAIIKEESKLHWVGFYLVKGSELVLGPFQGPLACTRIAFGKGVCGQAWKEKKSLLVADVHQFEGHIACSALTNSELVVPLVKNQEVLGVLDLDSIELNDFKSDDLIKYQEIAEYLTSLF